AWAGTLAFSGQIFCDFAGYSTTAIGAALCLGFAMPDNSRFPYAAVGFSDFWRRWHITLSSWLRDYLYIPLGGNRHGARRTYAALMTTMTLGGLWHGANWTFVAWGLLHGSLLVVYWMGRNLLAERGAGGKAPFGMLRAVGNWALTFTCVCIGWVFFRARSFSEAWGMLGSMFGWHRGHAEFLLPGQRLFIVVVFAGALAVESVIEWRTQAAGRRLVTTEPKYAALWSWLVKPAG